MTEQKSTKKLPKIITQVDDFGRKKFTLQQKGSQSQGEQKQQKFIDTGRYKSTLQGRQQKIDTQKYLGKLEGNKKKKKTQVFYCQICKVGFKCDLAYITHVNSPSHNRKLGMNMKVQAVSVQTVSQKLARMAQQKNKSKAERMMEKKLGKQWEKKLLHEDQDNKQQLKLDFKKCIGPQKNNQDNQSKNNNNHHQQNVVQQNNQQVNEVQQQSQDPDQKMMRQLGLPTSFGSKKKKY